MIGITETETNLTSPRPEHRYVSLTLVVSCFTQRKSGNILSGTQNNTFVTEYPHLLEATRQNEKPQVMNLRDRMQVIKYTCRELTQRGLFRLRRRGRRHHRVPVAPWRVSAVRGVGP